MVKRFFIYLVFVALCLTGLTNCQKSSINGDLDGRWQVMEIIVDDNSFNIKDEQLYYNFYLHVCNLSYYGGVYTEGNLEYDGKELKMTFPNLEYGEPTTNLMRFGIYSNPVEFTVLSIDKKRLVMENDKSMVILRKF